MPTCHKCGKMDATAMMRRTTKGHVCKDKVGCDHDRRIKATGGDPGPRDLQRMFRF